MIYNVDIILNYLSESQMQSYTSLYKDRKSWATQRRQPYEDITKTDLKILALKIEVMQLQVTIRICKRQGTNSLLYPPKRVRPCQNLDFSPLMLISNFWTEVVWKNKFLLFLSHPVCGKLSQQPKETNSQTILKVITECSGHSLAKLKIYFLLRHPTYFLKKKYLGKTMKYYITNVQMWNIGVLKKIQKHTELPYDVPNHF